jgi:BMFP domain-containing protein YqiC
VATDQKVDLLLARIEALEADLAKHATAAEGEDNVVAHAFAARPKTVANG